MKIVLLWIIAIVVCVCPFLGILLLPVLYIVLFGTEEKRDKYVEDSSNYYRRRNWYFKNHYGI